MSYGIYTQEGIKKGLIYITEDESVITYIHQNLTRNYKNPEEKVQAEIFCKLVLWYKYPVEKIGLYVPVTDGSTKKQADIFVYNDSSHTSPLIVIECKKEDVSEQEFAQATNQAFSYAHFTAGISNMYGLLRELKMHISSSIRKAALGKLFPIYHSTASKNSVHTNMPIMAAPLQAVNNYSLL